MGADAIRIGPLFTVTGSYRTIGRLMLNDARLAFEEINDDRAFPFRFEAVSADPGGCSISYTEAAERMLAEERLVRCW